MSRTGSTRLTLLFAFVACTVGGVTAEVSVDSHGNRANTLMMDPVGIVDDADPVPAVGWQPFRPVPDGHMLNGTGVIRPDGRPDVAWHWASNWPITVWAYNNGADHDIVLSAWNGIEWGGLEYLTSSVEDELDPRVFLERNGPLHVTWWVDGAEPHVMHTLQDLEGDPTPMPVRISPVGQSAYRPTIAVHQDVLWAAWERDADGTTTAKEIVIARRLVNGGSFVEDHVIAVPRTAELDPVLHVRGQLLWLDWKHSETHFGWKRRIPGGWTATAQVPWNDASWVGIETRRKTIRRAVMQSIPQEPIEPPD